MRKGVEQELLSVAAENCFWNLNSQVLRHLCKHLAIDIGKKASLFKVCSALVDGILDVTEEQRLDCLKKRALHDDLVTDNLLDCADAGEVLGREDQTELNKTMQEQKKQLDDKNEFRSHYRAARQAHAKARAKASSASGSRSAGSASSSGPSAAQLRRAPESTVPQPSIQAYAPPTCHIWRDLGRGAWHSHLEGHRCFSRRWDHYGESGSAWLVLKHSWRLYLEHTGESLLACPVSGLFVGDAAKDADDTTLPPA